MLCSFRIFISRVVKFLQPIFGLKRRGRWGTEVSAYMGCVDVCWYVCVWEMWVYAVNPMHTQLNYWWSCWRQVRGWEWMPGIMWLRGKFLMSRSVATTPYRMQIWLGGDVDGGYGWLIRWYTQTLYDMLGVGKKVFREYIYSQHIVIRSYGNIRKYFFLFS